MVRWSVPAKHDLKAIYDYIKRDSEYYAKKVTHNIIEKSEKLDRFPQMGRIVPETGDSSIRELLVYSYRLVYEISSTGIDILGLIHSRQKYSQDNFNE